MGFFNKKKAAPQVEAEANKTKAPKGRSKNNELIKVLDESVWESVHEELKANTQFVITNEDGTSSYVAMMFDTAQCGGLAGKEARKDESKGSIIEAIKIGTIKTYVRVEMLMDGVFIIIPDIKTIDTMDEYGILSDAHYELCTISEDGSQISTVDADAEGNPVVVSFDEIRNVIQNGLDVHVLFPGGNTAGAMFGFDAPTEEDPLESAMENVPDDISDDLDDLGDEIDTLPDELDDLSDDIEPVTPVAPVAPVTNANAQATPAPAPEPVTPVDEYLTEDESLVGEDASIDDEGGYDEFEDITEEVVHDFVVHKFYSEDLGLEVSTAPFDAQFVHGNTFIPFNENRGSGKLNEEVSNIAKDANTYLARMHQENIRSLRTLYMQRIQEHCKNISAALDISDDSTQYGMMRFAIDQNKQENLEAVNGAVETKRKQLNEAWNRKLDYEAEKAAAEARAQYEARYGRSHESDLQNIVSREKDEIERDYQASINRLNEDRRAEASKLLDIAISEVLTEMSKDYLKVLHAEQSEQARLQRQITKYIDANRKDEKARIEALAEERRQTKEAEEVRREYASKFKTMAAEFDLKKTVLQAEIDKMRQDHDIEIGKIESEWNKRLNEEKGRNLELKKQLDDCLTKYRELSDNKDAEYKKRMDEIKAEKESWERRTDDIVKANKQSADHSSRMAIVLLIAACIAALGVGFMTGVIKTSEMERSTVTQSYQVEDVNADTDSSK